MITITSKLIHGESVDISGKNKKNIVKFITAFEETKGTADEEQKAEWRMQLEEVRQSTIKIAEEEAKKQEEIDKVMNFSTGNRYITYAIIAINVVVFLAMALTGVSIFEPTGIDIIKWGANFAPLTLSGDWWRLLSCVFVHIGIIHIAFNMYALLSVGIYLEPMLGKTRYIVAYLCTGVFASLASLWWHTEPVPSAGASGAIFGMYGVFLALLTTHIIPKQIRKALLQSIVIFVGYNLLYGLKSGIDNAAHMGGLLSGALIGYAYYFTLKAGNNAKLKQLVTGSIVVITIIVSYAYIEIKKVPASEREIISKSLEDASFKDGTTFNELFNEIIILQDNALAPLKDTVINEEQRAKRLMETSLPEWEKAKSLADKLKKLSDISDAQKKKAEIISEYIDERKREIQIIHKIVTEYAGTTDFELPIQKELKANREKMDSLVNTLNGL